MPGSAQPPGREDCHSESPTRAGLASPELFRANFCLVQEALQPKTFLIAIKKITDHFYIHFMWFDDGGFQGSV